MITHSQTLRNTPIDGTFVRRVLLQRGFHEVKSAAAQLRFRRGGALRTVFAFSPAKWRTDVAVDTESGKVRIDVRTTGQIVTPSEQAFVDTFADELFYDLANHPTRPRSALSTDVKRSSSELEKSATSNNVRMAVATMVFSGFGTFAFFAFFAGNFVLAFVSFSVAVVLSVYAVAGGRNSEAPNDPNYD